MSQPFSHLKGNEEEKTSNMDVISLAQAKLIAEVETIKAQVALLKANPTCKLPSDSVDLGEFSEFKDKIHGLIMKNIEFLEQTEIKKDFADIAKTIDQMGNLMRLLDIYRTTKVRNELIKHIDFPTRAEAQGY